MTADHDLRSHQEMWNSFTVLIKWSIGLIVVILGGMAYFLL